MLHVIMINKINQIQILEVLERKKFNTKNIKEDSINKR